MVGQEGLIVVHGWRMVGLDGVRMVGDSVPATGWMTVNANANANADGNANANANVGVKAVAAAKLSCLGRCGVGAGDSGPGGADSGQGGGW